MATPMAIAAVMVLLLSATQLRPTCAQGSDGTCSSQPVVAGLDPPSGTTGTDVRGSTYYTLSGQRLDQLAGVFVLVDRFNLTTLNTMSNSTHFSFYIEDARLRRFEIVNATMFVVPSDRDCLVTNISMVLSAECKLES